MYKVLIPYRSRALKYLIAHYRGGHVEVRRSGAVNGVAELILESKSVASECCGWGVTSFEGRRDK